MIKHVGYYIIYISGVSKWGWLNKNMLQPSTYLRELMFAYVVVCMNFIIGVTHILPHNNLNKWNVSNLWFRCCWSSAQQWSFFTHVGSTITHSNQLTRAFIFKLSDLYDLFQGLMFWCLIIWWNSQKKMLPSKKNTARWKEVHHVPVVNLVRAKKILLYRSGRKIKANRIKFKTLLFKSSHKTVWVMNLIFPWTCAVQDFPGWHKYTDEG